MTTAKASNHNLKKSFPWVATGAAVLYAASMLYNEYKKYDLKGRVVLITGGARGLGLALAREFARHGARLAICSRSSDQLAKAKMELQKFGVEVLALTIDVTDKEEVDILVRDVVNYFGRIDVLVNNAGTIQVGPQETMDLQDYRDAMNTHFWAPLYTMHACLSHFINQQEGRIVNITSIGGKIAVPHLLPYSASKFALVGLSEGMHAELKKQNIHVTTAVPNLMRTGSPRNVTVKGNHQSEYSWFKYSDSLPLTSQAADNAAKGIIKALVYGDSEVVLTLSARLATLMKGLAPSWVNGFLAFANRLSPETIPGGFYPRKGYELERERTSGKISQVSDRAAVKYNQH